MSMYYKILSLLIFSVLPICVFSQLPKSQNELARTAPEVALNVSGWSFGNNRFKEDNSDENGRIIYQIRVDSGGNIVSARPVQQTVSPSVESFYRRQVMSFKLRPKDSITPSDLSIGTLTININANSRINSQLMRDTISENRTSVYVSILRYRGKIIDISPINRDYFGEEDFNSIVHKVSKSSMEASDALEMVSNYNWQANGNKIYKVYTNYNQKDPTFISRTIEFLRVK